MPESYKKIDYRLRPSKSIERKMFSEAFRRLSPFARVNSYRYVGFGSLYFSDFTLFHKAHGFNDMVSIEAQMDPSGQARFEFNKPYNSVQLRFGYSRDVLPKLAWDARTIFWLDYDTTLTEDILDDVSLICNQAAAGSVLIVTVCMPSTRGSEDDEEGTGSPLSNLKKRVGAERVPPDVTSKDLAGWGASSILRDIINNEIEESLKNRNGVLPENRQMLYDQVFYFHYADGMRIMTVGGVLFDAGQTSIFNTCGFSDLEFVRSGNEPYRIDPPLLTFREMRALERRLPGESDFSDLPISADDVEKFRNIYRHFPVFAETDL